jgi:hypothetical protein
MITRFTRRYCATALPDLRATRRLELRGKSYVVLLRDVDHSADYTQRAIMISIPIYASPMLRRVA